MKWGIYQSYCYIHQLRGKGPDELELLSMEKGKIRLESSQIDQKALAKVPSKGEVGSQKANIYRIVTEEKSLRGQQKITFQRPKLKIKSGKQNQTNIKSIKPTNNLISLKKMLMSDSLL